jgi:hypothetical protein
MTSHEQDAAAARAVSDRQRLQTCAQIEALIANVRDAHPSVSLHDLAEFLPEFERARLLALLEELKEIVPFPIERESKLAVEVTQNEREAVKPNGTVNGHLLRSGDP